MMRHRVGVFAAAVFLIAALLMIVVLGTDIPLGVTGQWAWRRLPFAIAPLPWTVAAAAFAAAALVARRLDLGLWKRRRKRALFAIWIAGTVAGIAILSAGRAGFAENVLAVLNRFSTGYLEESVRARSGDLTRNFRSRTLTVPPGEAPLHRHVHPQGNVLFAHGVRTLIPSGAGALLLPGTAGELDALAPEILLPPMSSPQVVGSALNIAILFAAAWFGGLGLLIALIPRFRLRSPGLAALGIAFGSGAGLLFLGHYDTLYFGITAVALYAIGRAFRGGGAGWMILAGAALAFGASCTLAYGALIAGLAAVLWDRPRMWMVLTATGAGCCGIAALCGVELIPAALQCWSNHRHFHATLGMGWHPWVWFNLLDAFLFAGAAAVLAGFAGWGAWGRNRFAVTGAAIWTFLIFSGTARGEFGRLEIYALPVLLAMLGYGLGQVRERGWLFYLIPGAMLCQTAILRNALKLVLID